MRWDSLKRVLFSSDSITVSLLIGGVGLCFLILRGRSHKKLNKRLSGAYNADGDHCRWLKTPWGLFIKPIIGYYREEIAADISTISAYFGTRFSFILPAPWYLNVFKFRFWLVKELKPIPRPRRSKKWQKSSFLWPGQTIDGKAVRLAQECLILVLGIPDSGKSKVAYELLEQLAAKKDKSRIVVVDITKTFPKRICTAVGAKRIITTDGLLVLAEELAKENQRRQALLDRFDVDHVRHLSSEHNTESIWVFIDEAHLLFSRDQDLKSERGKEIREAAELLNEIIITGRKTQISIVYLSQSALKSETLINIGRSKTVITGYLPPSESEAIGLGTLAVNTGLRKGVFLVRTADTGPEAAIMRAWRRLDKDLDKPLDSFQESPGRGG